MLTVTIAVVCGVTLIVCAVLTVVFWGMIESAAGREFERELRRYAATDGDMITALRRDLYQRAGLRPMMAGPVPRRAPLTGRASPG